MLTQRSIRTRAGWAKEGILDALVPMTYNQGTFAGWLDGMIRWKADRHAYAGMRFGRRAGADLAISQIKAAREKGAEGICGFAFNAGQWREAFAQALRDSVFQTSPRRSRICHGWQSLPKSRRNDP